MAIYDPRARSPWLQLWLSAMEPADAASIMVAMQKTFPVLRGNGPWARDIEKVCAGMSDEERTAIADRAEQIGERILDEMETALGHRPYLR